MTAAIPFYRTSHFFKKKLKMVKHFMILTFTRHGLGGMRLKMAAITLNRCCCIVPPSRWPPLLLSQNRLFNDWIMQEMAIHSLGRTTLLHKSVLPITMIFSMISFLEKSY